MSSKFLDFCSINSPQRLKLSKNLVLDLRSTLLKGAKGHILPLNPLVLALPFVLPESKAVKELFLNGDLLELA